MPGGCDGDSDGDDGDDGQVTHDGDAGRMTQMTADDGQMTHDGDGRRTDDGRR